jgi:hypothetical protein
MNASYRSNRSSVCWGSPRKSPSSARVMSASPPCSPRTRSRSPSSSASSIVSSAPGGRNTRCAVATWGSSGRRRMLIPLASRVTRSSSASPSTSATAKATPGRPCTSTSAYSPDGWWQSSSTPQRQGSGLALSPGGQSASVAQIHRHARASSSGAPHPELPSAEGGSSHSSPSSSTWLPHTPSSIGWRSAHAAVSEQASSVVNNIAARIRSSLRPSRSRRHLPRSRPPAPARAPRLLPCVRRGRVRPGDRHRVGTAAPRSRRARAPPRRRSAPGAGARRGDRPPRRTRGDHRR